MRLSNFILGVVLGSSFSPLALAQENETVFFQTPAKHLIIVDYDTGEILFEKNARMPMQPASMTKIMTAIIVFDRLRDGSLSLDTEFTVSEDAWERGGAKSGSSTMFLKPKSNVSVQDLLYGVIVQSGNDACIVLAQGIAGSERAFADLMNQKAQELGLKSAHFTNATGWPDPDHVISAKDMAVLADYTIREFPDMYTIYGVEEYTWNGITQPNRNPLLLAGFTGADGLKTGHTNISKYGFAGSAKIDGKRRIFVVNGLKSKADRRTESLRLIRSAFGEFKSYKLFGKEELVGSAKVFMGKTGTVPLIAHEDIWYGLHRSQRSGLTARIQYDSPIPAPIIKGDKLGQLVINAPGKVAKTVPLFAGGDVKRKSFMGRLAAALVAKIRGE